MIAWKAYQETDEYANTLKWAMGPARRKEVVEASLWAAFLQGFMQGGLCVGQAAARRDQRRVGLPGADDES